MLLHAHKIGAAANVSVFHYWQLVMGAILGFTIWETTLTTHLVAGSVVIIASGFLMRRQEQKVKAA